MNPQVELVLGGARSGKSRFAEQRMAQLAQTFTTAESFYIATATAGDGEMSERIKLHRQQRPGHWHTREQPLALAAELAEIERNCPAGETALVLVDCLTLWVTNCLLHDWDEEATTHGAYWQQQKQALLAFIGDTRLKLVMVSNEVGQGIVPMGELSRCFVDESGWLHQEIAALASQVDLIVAGLPLNLKTSSRTVNKDVVNKDAVNKDAVNKRHR